ncbi:MAG: L-histidine N(alpha)-methyltransferase, partial [Lysobacterales bacterium]
MAERQSGAATVEPADASGAPGYTFHDHAPAPDNFREAVLHGLAQAHKAIPFRFLYDAAGSRLFEQICQQPEYYLTRTELALLENHAGDIAARVGPGAQLVELGSGAGIKVERLLAALTEPTAYIAVEISRPALVAAVQRLAADWPALDIHAVWADYASGFSLPLAKTQANAQAKAGPVLGFFPGSSIGNLRPAQAQSLLATWRQRLGAGAHLVIGVDLIKAPAVLEAA